MSERAHPAVKALSIGVNIRRYRTAEGLTLKELAERSGVSIATISKIENGKISGGFETIYKIARGLGVLVTEIIIEGNGGEECQVVHRRDKADVHRTALYDYYPQAFRRAGALNPYVMVIHTREPPDPRDWSVHDGEEVVLVLSGRIDLHQENAAPVRLDEGDSACFESGRRHCFVCASARPARILSVSTRGPATRTAGRLTYS
ncbi:MAG: XRE family transcriptional regulator [Rhodospirillales bacterium]|nr:XRE family transcriptional regulator [Rhodospirillales bacterium]